MVYGRARGDTLYLKTWIFRGRRLLAWLAFALIGHWGIAVGSPYTVYFGGTTASYYDLASNTIVAGNAGLAFSGLYTFDLAYAEHFSSFDNPGSYALTTASSDSGCNVVQESVCATDTGFAAAVITGYSISTPFAPSGGYQLIAGSANLGDYSVLQN